MCPRLLKFDSLGAFVIKDFLSNLVQLSKWNLMYFLWADAHSNLQNHNLRRGHKISWIFTAQIGPSQGPEPPPKMQFHNYGRGFHLNYNHAFYLSFWVGKWRRTFSNIKYIITMAILAQPKGPNPESMGHEFQNFGRRHH